MNEINIKSLAASGSNDQPAPRQCQCGAVVEPLQFAGKWHAFEQCQACDEKSMEELREMEELKRRERRTAEIIEQITPKAYRETVENRLGSTSRELIAKFSSSDFSGVWLRGETGRGKTRTAYLLLHAAIRDGMSAAVVTHQQFSRTVIAAYAGEKAEKRAAQDALRAWAKAEWLLFDDLGKAPNSERVDSEFEELIEHRTSHGKGIILTSNAKGAWIEKSFGADRGAPIVRRLAEFCQVIDL